MKINLDNGFLFGKGVFETIKIIDSKPIMFKEHLLRLNSSLKDLGIKKEIGVKEIMHYISSLEDKNYALKIVVSDTNTTLIKKDDKYININRLEGINLKLGKLIRNSTSYMVYHKSLNYYDNIIENNLAKEEGFQEVVFLNERAEIAEGSVSNIFFVKNNDIFTPPISCGILKGTMRDYIIQKYNVTEKIIKLEDLDSYQSIFISNALMGIRWVSSFNNKQYYITEIIKTIIKDLKLFGF